MTAVAPSPVGFRCNRCFQTTCATSEDVGQTVPCISCREANVVPAATPERVQAGQEFIANMQTLHAVPTAETAAPSTNPYQSPAEYVDPYAPPPQAPEIKLATRWQRFLGVFIDGAVSMVVVAGGWLFASVFLTEDLAGIVAGGLMLALVIVQWCMITADGKTIGKLFMNTKIVDISGNPPGFFKGVFMRVWVISLLGAIPILGIFISLANPLWIFTSHKNQCLHDKLAGTYVIQG